jgi:chromatin remodeling complex protein RSC6
MVRTVKSAVASDVSPAPAATPAVKPTKAAAAVAAPAAAAPAKATKAAAPAAAPAATAAPTAPETTEAVATVNAFDEVNAKVVAAAALLKELQGLLKTLSKEHEKIKKVVEKTERKRANARNNPNGFAKPSKIVDELCDFCGVARGTKMSRTDVTRSINSYIKEKNLNKPENKRIIIPDEKLRTLLKLKVGDEVNYFKVQSFISPLFIKETAAAPPA